jgi:hypothetical protein
MLSNSENLNVYLQCAFDHFSQDLHTPFDFMDVSFKINPIPLDFGGNILKLAVALKSRFEDPKRIFKELSHMVASCILLDCVRQDLKGNPCPPPWTFAQRARVHQLNLQIVNSLFPQVLQSRYWRCNTSIIVIAPSTTSVLSSGHVRS